MKKRMMGLAACIWAGVSFGETISLFCNDAQIDGVWIESFGPGRSYYNWGGRKVPAAESSPRPGNAYVVPNGIDLRYDNGEGISANSYAKRAIFGGDSLQIGETASGTAAKLVTWSNRYLDAADLRLVNAVVYCNDKGDAFLWGTNTLSNVAGTHWIGGSGVAANTSRRFVLVQTFVCDEPDLTICAYISSDGTDGQRGSVVFADRNDRQTDMSRYKGRFSTGRIGSALEFTGVNSLPAYEAVRADAITLSNKTSLVLGPNVNQPPTCGVTIAPGATATVENSGAALTLRLPVSGGEDTTVVRTKELRSTLADDHTVTLENDWSGFAGTLDLADGVTVISDAATGLDGLKIRVRSGATLYRPALSNLNIEAEPGAIILNAPIVVPFAEGVTTPIDQTAMTKATYDQIEKPLNVRLSQALTLPINEPLELPCVTFAPGVADCADFADLTERQRDLPQVRLELRSDAASGNEVLYLLVKPAVTMVIPKGDYAKYQNIILTNAQVVSRSSATDIRDIWSDGERPRAGRDYAILDYSETYTGEGWHTWFDFPGDRLYVAAPMNTRARNNHINELILDPVGSIWSVGCGSGLTPHVFTGKICIAPGGTSTSQARIVGTCDWKDHRWNGYDIRSEISGSGWVSLQGKSWACPNYLRGTNTAYTGCFVLEMGANALSNAVYHLSNGQALGGPRPAGNADNYRAIWLKGDYNGISAMEDLTLAEANRGIYVSGTGVSLGADADKTLTLDCEMRLTNGVRKTGTGSLVLKRTPKFGADGLASGNGRNNVLSVEEGCIKAAGKDGYESLKVSFAEGTGIAVDFGATGDARRYGVRFGSVEAVSIAGDSLLLRAEGKAGFDRQWGDYAICSVPAEADDLTAKLETAANLRALKPAKGFGVTIVKDAETLASEGLVRYVARVETVGFSVLVR